MDELQGVAALQDGIVNVDIAFQALGNDNSNSIITRDSSNQNQEESLYEETSQQPQAQVQQQPQVQVQQQPQAQV